MRIRPARLEGYERVIGSSADLVNDPPEKSAGGSPTDNAQLRADRAQRKDHQLTPLPVASDACGPPRSRSCRCSRCAVPGRRAACVCLVLAIFWLNLDWLLTPRVAIHTRASLLITGCSSGLGRHAALHLASLDSISVFAGVRSQRDADSLQAEAHSRGIATGKIRPVMLDVTDAASIDAAAQLLHQAVKTEGYPPLVGVVNNAGISRMREVGNTSLADVRLNFEVNLFGAVALTERFLPMLEELEAGGGRIVFVGSVVGLVALPKSFPYSGTKFALEGYVDAIRPELAPRGVSVSIIEPGFVATHMCQMKFCREDGLDLVTAAMRHSLLDPFPRSRYPVAHVLFLPAWVLPYLLAIVPDRLLDRVLTAAVAAVR